MIKTITSKDNAKIKFACSLKESKNRKKEGLFLAETFKALEMALTSDMVVEIFTLKSLDIDDKIPQYLVSEEVLKKLSSNVNPEGVVFIAKIKEYLDKTNFNKILYLDHVSDPGNVGTLIRTALAFSYDAVVLSEGSCSIYNEKVVNSTKGAIFMMPVYNDDISNYLDHQIIVSALDKDAISLEEVKFKNKFVLVIGNESHGVSEEVLKLANIKVIIPINNIDSLNAAFAGGILMNKIH